MPVPVLCLPSPLVELLDDRLMRHGVCLYLKRDDLIHPELKGNKWRKLRQRGALTALATQRPGPKPVSPDPLQAELSRLRAENARLQARLAQAETIIDVQKKLRRCLGRLFEGRHRPRRDRAGRNRLGRHYWCGQCLCAVRDAALYLLSPLRVRLTAAGGAGRTRAARDR